MVWEGVEIPRVIQDLRAVVWETGCTSEKSCCSAGNNQVESRQELRSTGGNCQGDDRQESCSSAGPDHVTEHALFTWMITHLSRD